MLPNFEPLGIEMLQKLEKGFGHSTQYLRKNVHELLKFTFFM